MTTPEVESRKVSLPGLPDPVTLPPEWDDRMVDAFVLGGTSYGKDALQADPDQMADRIESFYFYGGSRQ